MIVRARQAELELEAARLLASGILEQFLWKNVVTLGVVGGRSVKGVLEHLRNIQLDWSKVHFFMVDERLVPLDHPDSNFRLIKEALAGGDIPPENLHPFVSTDSSDYGVHLYQQELEKCGGKLDLLLLSAGEDGHIGSLFPGHQSIENEAAFFFIVDDSPKPPAVRMAASKKLLSKADHAVLLLLGEEKRETLRRISDSSVATAACPAKLIYEIPEYYILTDMEDQ